MEKMSVTQKTDYISLLDTIARGAYSARGDDVIKALSVIWERLHGELK